MSLGTLCYLFWLFVTVDMILKKLSKACSVKDASEKDSSSVLSGLPGNSLSENSCHSMLSSSALLPQFYSLFKGKENSWF